MATRSIVPRASTEGGIGTLLKHWGTSYIDNMFGNLTGTASYSTTAGNSGTSSISGTSSYSASASNAGSAASATTAANAGTSYYSASAGLSGTSSISGTASKATSAGVAGSASFAGTSSLASTANYSTGAGTSLFSTGAGTSYFATSSGKAASADYAGTSSIAGTSGYATSAAKAGTSAYTGTASLASTANYSTGAGTASYATTAGQAGTALISGTSAYATSAAKAGTAPYSGTASYATSAGLSGTSSYSTTSGVSGTAPYSGTSYLSTTAGQAGTASFATTAANAGTSTTQPDNTSTTQIATTAFTKGQIAVLSNPKAMSQAVNMTVAASGSTGIQVADNDNIDFGTGNFTLVWKGSLPDWTGTVYFFYKTQDSTHRYTFLILSGSFVVQLNATSYTSTIPNTITAGTYAEIVVVVTRESSSVAGSVVFFVNGVQFGDSIPITAGAPASISNTDILYIVGASTVRYASNTSMVAAYNRALTAADVLDLYRNGINFADKWGCVTAVYTSDFSAGVDGWSPTGGTLDGNIDIGGYTDTLRFTSDAATSEHLIHAHVYPTLDKKYRVSFEYYIPSTNTTLIHIIPGGITTALTVLDTWTACTYDCTLVGAGTSLNIYGLNAAHTTTFAGTAGDLFYIKNVVVTEIGATLALESEGIQFDKWYDSSSNGLDATYPAVGASLARMNTRRCKQPTPTAETTSATLTVAELLTGIITGTHTAGATQTYTLPTGTLTDAGGTFGINSFFDWTLINLSAAAADTITVAARTDHTIVGNPIVQSAHASTGGIYGNSGMFRTRKTAANTFITYRIA